MRVYNSQLFEMNSKELIMQQGNEMRQIIERCARQWFQSQQDSYYLLRGEFLTLAEKFYLTPGNRLSSNALKFILASIELRHRSDNLAKVKENSQLIGAVTATAAVVSMFTLSTTSLSGMVEAEAGSTFNTIEIIR